MIFDGKQDIYKKNYGEGYNAAIAGLIPEGPHQVLDVGCSGGALLQVLKQQNRAKHTIGIEYSKEAAQLAEAKVDKVICGKVEELDLSELRGSIDYIVYADVIEHMVDPWKVIRSHKDLLSPQGKMLFCIPNVRNFHVLTKLLSGRWDYAECGIMDVQHVRFFTLNNINEYMTDLQLHIHHRIGFIRDANWYENTGLSIPDEYCKLHDIIYNKLLKSESAVQEMALITGQAPLQQSDIAEFFTSQFIIIAANHPSSEPELAKIQFLPAN